MFCRIRFSFREAGERPGKEDVEDLLWGFLACLFRNGQISRTYSLVREGDYFAYVTCPEDDSLREENDNAYVAGSRKKLGEIFACSVEKLGENVESAPACTCKKHSAVEMQTFHYDIDSIFTCLDCGRPIPLYRLPVPRQDQVEFFHEESWQQDFAAMERLWINCLCDRFSGRQLFDPASALNREGRELAENMSRALGCPVYYNLYDDGTRRGRKGRWTQTEHGKLRLCPKCGAPMRLFELENYASWLCDACMSSVDDLGEE